MVAGTAGVGEQLGHVPSGGVTWSSRVRGESLSSSWIGPLIPEG